jgi:hypothetical protein
LPAPLRILCRLKIVGQMQRSPQNVRFDDLAKVCADDFGEPRQDGTSHKVYKTP